MLDERLKAQLDKEENPGDLGSLVRLLLHFFLSDSFRQLARKVCLDSGSSDLLFYGLVREFRDEHFCVSYRNLHLVVGIAARHQEWVIEYELDFYLTLVPFHDLGVETKALVRAYRHLDFEDLVLWVVIFAEKSL